MPTKIICSLILACLIFIARAQETKLILPIGHTQIIRDAAFSADGKKLVTVSDDHLAKIWETSSGLLLANLSGHTAPVSSACFNPAGTLIATASDDSTVKIWDVTMGTLRYTIRNFANPVDQLSFSPDGSKLLTFSQEENIARIWNVQSHVLIAELKEQDTIADARFNPDGKKIVTGSNGGNVKIWNSANGVLLRQFNAHDKEVSSVVFSPDGSRVLSAGGDKTAKVWDVGSGRLVFTLQGHLSALDLAVFSPDGYNILTIASGDRVAKLWDGSSGRLLTNIVASDGEAIEEGSFSPDGALLLTRAKSGVSDIWNARTGVLQYTLEDDDEFCFHSFFSPDGKKILTVGGSLVTLWDAVTGHRSMVYRGHSNNLRFAFFTDNGEQIITNHGIWEPKTGTFFHIAPESDTTIEWECTRDNKKMLMLSLDGTGRIIDLKTHVSLATFRTVDESEGYVHFSTDGSVLFEKRYQQDSLIRVLDGETGLLRTNLHINGISVFDEDLCPDGKRILTVGYGSYAYIWDAATGNLQTRFYIGKRSEHFTQFSPDGQKILVFSYQDSIVRQFDMNSYKPLVMFYTPPVYPPSPQSPFLNVRSGAMTEACYSPDGNKVVTWTIDGYLRLWDGSSGNLIFGFQAHKNSILGVRFSRDGNMFFTMSWDNTVKVWDSHSGTLISELKGHEGELTGGSFSPDGQYVVTISSDNSLKQWNTRTGELLYTFFSIDHSDYLVMDRDGHYDGSEAARKLLYFKCGAELIFLDQVKEQLWVPGLVERIMKGNPIEAPVLADLPIAKQVPHIEDLSPGNGSFRFAITPQEGGLGEISLQVNGIDVREYRPQELSRQGKSYILHLSADELKAFFDPGQDNNITVKAQTAQTNIYSRGATVAWHDLAPPISTPPNLYAVMVGVSNYYKDKNLQLHYAAKDVRDLAKTLKVSAEHMLNTDGRQHVFIYNLTTDPDSYAMPEKKAIRQVFEKIGETAKANDIILVFFTGHGVVGRADRHFYFLTADASSSTMVNDPASVGISIKELSKWIDLRHFKARKRILIIDACNSGAANNEWVTVRNDDDAERIKEIEKLKEKSGMFILSASAANQSAYEMKKYSQGLLTYALLKSIKEDRSILTDNRFLNVGRWFDAASNMVSELSAAEKLRQQPQIASTTNFDIGMVDDAVTRTILLPTELPLFTKSAFRNESTGIDDIRLGSLIDRELMAQSADVVHSSLRYDAAYEGLDAWSLFGSYTLVRNNLTIHVLLTKGGTDIVHRFDFNTGSDATADLAKKIIASISPFIIRTLPAPSY